MNDFDDEFTDIFDHLTPEDFFIESSAISEDEGLYKGAASFDLHIEEAIRSVKVSLATSWGQMKPVAILSNEKTRRTFTPTEDETLGQFLERLQREARTLGARWFFFAKRHELRLYDEEEGVEIVDAATDEAVETAIKQGKQAETAIFWYAERREANETQVRQGVLHLSPAGDQVTHRSEGDERQQIGIFGLILDAVT